MYLMCIHSDALATRWRFDHWGDWPNFRVSPPMSQTICLAFTPGTYSNEIENCNAKLSETREMKLIQRQVPSKAWRCINVEVFCTSPRYIPREKEILRQGLSWFNYFHKKKMLCFRKDCHSPKAAMQSKAEERKWKKCIFNFAEKNMLNIGTPCSLKSCFWKEGVFFKENEMRMLAASCRLAS